MLQVDLREDRYDRQALIEWWDQNRVRRARVLVIGAGALGNEILKLLALIGVGNTLVFDPDKIERSNLSRSVLFRETDEGQLKADVAVRRMREINSDPDVRAHAINENVIVTGGLGLFAWADVVIGAVDNREARVFVSSACARVGKSWVDGAIEGFSGVVRVFTPATGPCYECTMNTTDRKLLAERRSCALLAREAVSRGRVPTSAVAASIIGAMEVQEAIKLVHGQPTLNGEGLHVDGLFTDASRVRYQRREDCAGHDHLGPLVALNAGIHDTTVGALLTRAEAELGEGASIDLSRDIVVRLTCPECGHTSNGGTALGAMRESHAACPQCRTHRVLETAASLQRGDGIDETLTLAALGVPAFDIVVARQGIERQVAWILNGDASAVLGDLAGAGQGEEEAA